ncbi:thiol:disulfide interchange protein DsbA/DsbL [Undibacterium macrobrachii]|jgi:thiol:disulfide interchange protein DsbA|uniref:Thiol:disulfide interchange protein DsbA n=1 Tax=Undibacterium macrobrachii TaxID=1119058 RepID=A0ABQ2XNX4_9BURK|nr:thiol:disulfide interchange protein DsbA/DsbL [Undibacterium macrobrachii]GGX25519.1 thiol:disulfide interchange protein [Undibacterium macrobrachii]
MRLFRQLLLISTAFLSFSAAAQEPRLGQEYTVLDRPQPTDSGKKVEVTEFFGYFCPACNAFEPYLEAWIKKQGDRIVVKRVHVKFSDLMASQQKLYFTLEAMGKVDEYQLKTFNAYHIDRNRLSSDADVFRYVDKVGLDKKKFTDIYNSFSIQSKVNRAAQLMSDYKINGVPTVAIDGRYIVSPADLFAKSKVRDGSHAGLVVMDWLVDKAYKEKNPASAAAPAVTKKK